MIWAQRPAWAKGLSRNQWSDLKVCQATNRPTLKRLKEDVEFQASSGVTCHVCSGAMAVVTETLQAKATAGRRMVSAITFMQEPDIWNQAAIIDGKEYDCNGIVGSGRVRFSRLGGDLRQHNRYLRPEEMVEIKS